jgi:hypothetical protein
VWTKYEQRLARALDELSATRQGTTTGPKTISAKTWLRVLVPFVTSLFVRGEEFSARYEERMARMGVAEFFSDPQHRSDNTNMARMIEFQRLLAPVMSARWVVMHTSSDHPVITNELGFTLSSSRDGSQAIVIPVGQDAILALVPTWPGGRVIMRDRGTGQWRAMIDHVKLEADDQRNFNRAMANMAESFLAGPTSDSVEIHQQALDADSPLNPEMIGSLWPRYRVLRDHQFEWYRAVTATSKNSSQVIQSDLLRRDWSVIAKGWSPFFVWPINLGELPTGLSLRDDKITLSLRA